jgi:limonene-1,2-epoxide hydrolase
MTMAMPVNRRSLVLGAPAALLAAHQSVGASPSRPKTSAREVNALLDAWLAAYSAVDIPRLVALMHEDIYFEDPTFHLKATNREEMKPIYSPLGTSFRNVRITPFNRIVAPPWGISQQRLAATLVRDSGESHAIDVQGVSMLQVRGGRIQRWYDYYDVLTFREQTKRRA